MKALTYHGDTTVRLEQVPDPEILEPGDAIVRVEVCAVCGSDLHVYHGRERGLIRLVSRRRLVLRRRGYRRHRAVALILWLRYW